MNDNAQLIKEWRKSPLAFVKFMWKLEAQEKDQPFIKNKQITWQQVEILKTIELALKDEAPRRISVVAGRGIGKSTTLSWLIIWFLFCFTDSQVACTAPTSDQMHNVLWKELSLWLNKLPKTISSLFEWQSGYLRIRESPDVWFASAKTARKENVEALAGVHGKHVLLIADEASGVDDQIFKVAEGSLTNKNTLFIVISNGRRLIGFFYDTHHNDKINWQTLSFSSIDSPIVEKGFVERIKEKYGEDSDEYRVEVSGQFPKTDLMDESGFVPLFQRDKFIFVPEHSFEKSQKIYLGLDPSGEGRDKSVWVIRDNFAMEKIAEEVISNPKSIAEKTITLMEHFHILPEDVFIDGFGVGAKVAREISLADGGEIQVILTSEKPNDENYLNLRAELGFRYAEWCNSGGKIISNSVWEELNTIKYKRNLQGKIQIMDKLQMRKLYSKSPDYFDAGSLTFCKYRFLGEELKPRVKQFKPRMVKSYW